MSIDDTAIELLSVTVQNVAVLVEVIELAVKIFELESTKYSITPVDIFLLATVTPGVAPVPVAFTAMSPINPDFNILIWFCPLAASSSNLP